MSKFNVGDLVILKSGSMRMCVEDIAEDETVHTVWCNEGVIGRDVFNPALLNKWEHREDSGGQRGGPGGHRGGGKPYGGDRDRDGGGGGKRFGGRDDRGGNDRGGRDDRGGNDRGGWDRGGRDGGGRDGGNYDDRPRKTGWDGKPRDKKFYRKDD